MVAGECICTWYWLADLCAPEGSACVLGHALSMKAIQGGKAKNDKLDSHKVAVLRRGGTWPMADGYPPQRRAPRDLLRRRCPLMRKRAELLAHSQNTDSQDHLPEFGKQVASKGHREGVAEHFPAPSVRKTMAGDLALSAPYDHLLSDLELYLARTAKQHAVNASSRLRAVPGIGKVLALGMLYEGQASERVPRVQDLVSSCRLVKCAKESAGKRHGLWGKKIGNAHLKGAFSAAAVLSLRQNKPGQAYCAKLEGKHGTGRALSVLAHNRARAGYYLLTREQAFDLRRLVSA